MCVCARVRAFVRAWDGYECKREYARAYVGICVSVYVCVHVRAGVFQCPRCIHKSVCACE